MMPEPMSLNSGARPFSRAKDLGARVIATAFFSGHSRFAPGTAGSAVGLLLFVPLSGASMPVQVLACIALFLVGVLAASHVARRVGLEDPGIVVVDEVLGMWLSVIGLPFTPVVALLAFLLFRVLDIVKPYPADALEHLPRGLGIMVDDVAAGLYANLLLRIGLLVWPFA
jgi:phosphatidylglycerophosphatase A